MSQIETFFRRKSKWRSIFEKSRISRVIIRKDQEGGSLGQNPNKQYLSIFIVFVVLSAIMTGFVNCASQSQNGLFTGGSNLFGSDECDPEIEDCEDDPYAVSADNIELNVFNPDPLYFENKGGVTVTLAGSCNTGGYPVGKVSYTVTPASGGVPIESAVLDTVNDLDYRVSCDRGKWSFNYLQWGNSGIFTDGESYILRVWITAYTASGIEKENQLMGEKVLTLIPLVAQ